VIKSIAELSLDGEVQLDFAFSGLSWQLMCPATRILYVAGEETTDGSAIVPTDHT
jgi:hypothetical protein